MMDAVLSCRYPNLIRMKKISGRPEVLADIGAFEELRDGT